jgi:hypothetical protein
MALTEEQKQKIEEEEAYRAKVRDEKKGKGCSGCLVAIILLVAALAITLIAINPAKQLETAEKNAQATIALETRAGSFQDFTGREYTYDISYKTGDDKYVASFQPFLKNDDRILVQAILDVFIEMYGENSLIDPTPLLEERNGVNLIKFRGDTGYYYVSPIKEDTGEIHTLMFWKE